ncbi:hypothetical protein LB489_14685, partial [Staphylococcus aureus]|nr:hypothetical protein [Staphylococcus aureus]
SAEYKHTHKHRGTSKGADVKIINRELSSNNKIRVSTTPVHAISDDLDILIAFDQETIDSFALSQETFTGGVTPAATSNDKHYKL